jgi:hypothetical protein
MVIPFYGRYMRLESGQRLFEYSAEPAPVGGEIDRLDWCGEGRHAHLNPRKAGVPREIADWTEARGLSDVIDHGAYNVKPMGNKKLVTLWFYWIPPSRGLLGRMIRPLRRISNKRLSRKSSPSRLAPLNQSASGLH